MFLKRQACVIITVFVLLSFAGCKEFYDMAVDGPGIIYSVTDDAMTYKELVITGGDGIYRYSTGIATAVTDLAVDGDSRVVMYNDAFTAGVTHYNDGFSESWTDINSGYPADCLSMAGKRYGIHLFAGTVGSYSVYYLDEGSLDTPANVFSSYLNLSAYLVGGSNVFMFSSSDDGEIYFYDDNGANSNLYRLHDGNLVRLRTSNTILTPFFGDRVGSYFYLGTGSALSRFESTGTGSAVVFSGPALITDYAVVSGSDIFCIDHTANWLLYRLNKATSLFEVEHDFSAAPTGVYIEPFRGNLAVGIKGGTADDGLYIYNIDDKSFKKLDSSPVLALKVR